MYLSFSAHWVAACKCATVWIIKNPNDRVRGGGDKGRGITPE